MQQYIINENSEILGSYSGGTLPDVWQVLEGPNVSRDELYIENGEIKQRPPKPSPDHFWSENGWILPTQEAVTASEPQLQTINWQGLEDDLRESVAWAQVYTSAGRTLKANRAFTFLYGTLTRTHNTSDLKLAIADTRDSMRGIAEIGDFSPEVLTWLRERLTANGLDPEEFDLNPLP